MVEGEWELPVLARVGAASAAALTAECAAGVGNDLRFGIIMRLGRSAVASPPSPESLAGPALLVEFPLLPPPPSVIEASGGWAAGGAGVDGDAVVVAEAGGGCAAGRTTGGVWPADWELGRGTLKADA